MIILLSPATSATSTTETDEAAVRLHKALKKKKEKQHPAHGVDLSDKRVEQLWLQRTLGIMRKNPLRNLRLGNAKK